MTTDFNSDEKEKIFDKKIVFLVAALCVTCFSLTLSLYYLDPDPQLVESRTVFPEISVAGNSAGTSSYAIRSNIFSLFLGVCACVLFFFYRPFFNYFEGPRKVICTVGATITIVSMLLVGIVPTAYKYSEPVHGVVACIYFISQTVFSLWLFFALKIRRRWLIFITLFCPIVIFMILYYITMEEVLGDQIADQTSWDVANGLNAAFEWAMFIFLVVFTLTMSGTHVRLRPYHHGKAALATIVEEQVIRDAPPEFAKPSDDEEIDSIEYLKECNEQDA